MFANLEQIEHTLKGLADLSDKKLTQDFLSEIIEDVIPESNEKFIWDIHTDFSKTTRLACNVTGRKNKAVVSVDDIISVSEGDEPSIHKKSLLSEKLHRLLSRISRSSAVDNSTADTDTSEPAEIALSWAFVIDYETAKAYRKRNGGYLRLNQWNDITVEVRVS